MNIIKKIKTSVEGSTGQPFIYGGDREVNELIADTELPCSFAYLVEQGQVTGENGFIHERLSVTVFFVNLTQFAADSMDNEDIIDAEKKKAFGWLSRLRLNRDLRLDSINGSQRVYQQFDDIVTGYAVTVTITEVDGIGLCNAPEPEMEETV